MTQEVSFNKITGYKEIYFLKHNTEDEETDSILTLVIKESGFKALHIELNPDEVATITKGFNWSKKINKGDK